jgi:hypothetical protein
MSKLAVRLLTLAMYATALAAFPMVTPADAAADSSRELKKKHKRMNATGAAIEAPRSSTQYPPNMSDDPARKVGGY